jgi:uncharacterized protein
MTISKLNHFRLKSNNGNDYLYSRNTPQILFIHPVLNYLMELTEKGISIKDWLDFLPDQKIEIEDGIFVDRKTFAYYFDFMKFLEKHHYFEEVKTYKMNKTRFNADIVKRGLANTHQIVFEVTNQCNLKCTYCGYGDLYSECAPRNGDSINLEAAKNILDYMVNLFESPLNRKSHKKITISFYGGEPLLNMPFIKSIVDYVKGKILTNKSFFFSITTNGVLLVRYMDFLVDNNFLLSISLDGDKENNKYRKFLNGTSSFRTVFDNIIALKKKYPKYFDTSVTFLSVLHSKNSNIEINTFFNNHFGKEPLIFEVNPSGIKPEKKKTFDSIFKRMYSGMKTEEILSNTKNKNSMMKVPFAGRLVKFLHNYSGFVYKSYHKLLYSYKEERRISTGTCDPFERKIFITVNGDILTCERIPQHFSLGRVDESQVHLDYQKIADQYNDYYGKMMEQCNHCANGDNCPLCIFTLNLNDEKVECKYYEPFNALRKYFSSSISLLEETPRYYPKIMKDFTLN